MAKAIQYRKRTKTKANGRTANAKPRTTRPKKTRLQ